MKAFTVALLLGATPAFAEPPAPHTMDYAWPGVALICDTEQQIADIMKKPGSGQDAEFYIYFNTPNGRGEPTCAMARRAAAHEVLEGVTLGEVDIGNSGIRARAWAIHIRNRGGVDGWAAFLEPAATSKPSAVPSDSI